MHQEIWHVLDVRAIWLKEFAAALAAQTRTLGWSPQITGTGIFRDQEEEICLTDPELRIRQFPLQRGFSKFPVNLIAGEANRLSRRLARCTRNPPDSVLVCSSPHYAPVAARWPGPVIYYVTDLFAAYGDDPTFVRRLDRKMCQAATLVCPNSSRIANYLMSEAHCPAAKIAIIPNATRAANVFSQSLLPNNLPSDAAGLSRPIAGVIGNLAANMDWVLLRKTIEHTPWLSWVFVGPAEMAISDPEQRKARNHLLAHSGRVRFVGPKRYGELQTYARSFDVAVLPYRSVEPTYSGSSTRFYEHLAAGRPILATRGFEELLHKEPLLRLTDSDEQVISALEELQKVNFRDGYEELRWRTSQGETWEARAGQMRRALDELVAAALDAGSKPFERLAS